MLTFLLIVQVVAAIILIGLVLMQNNKGAEAGAAFGGGGGSSQSVFGSQGSANFLTRMTSLMAVVFMLSSLALASLSARQNNTDTDLFAVPSAETQGAEVVDNLDSEVPVVPQVDAGQDVPVIDDVPVVEEPATEVTP